MASVYAMFAYHLFRILLMTEQLSRKERRLLQKLKKEQQKQQPLLDHNAPKPRVLPFVWIILGFVFITSVFAMVVGANMWVGHSVWPRTVGWSITALVGVGAFVYWTKMRKLFKFSKRWFVLFPLTFFIAVVCALVFVYLISAWQESTQLDYREQQNSALIQSTSSWAPGDVWSDEQCRIAQTQQHAFVDQLNQGTRPPYMGEILVLFSTMDVSYQAGCAPQWTFAIERLTATKSHWKNASASSVRGFNNFVSAQYPNSKKGCKMELTRLNQKQDAPLYSALKFLCNEIPEQSQWKPGSLTAQAQTLLQRVKRQEEFNANSPQ